MKPKKKSKTARKNPAKAVKKATNSAIKRSSRTAKKAAKAVRKAKAKPKTVANQLSKALGLDKNVAQLIEGVGEAATGVARKAKQALEDVGIDDVKSATQALKKAGRAIQRRTAAYTGRKPRRGKSS
jgi:ribosomal protein S19E (S16A)